MESKNLRLEEIYEREKFRKCKNLTNLMNLTM